jgi:hypothetical protein
MSERQSYPFGEPNLDVVRRWLSVPTDDDGPIWMVNLMKYRAVAEYGDDRDGTVSGKEADDAYAPVGPLAAIGAMVAFFGDVEAQLEGDPAWDRVGIVRYPTRASFFAMQQRADFQKQYTHKKAGMEFTIVMGCLPEWSAAEPVADPAGTYVMRVRRFRSGGPVGPEPAGVTPIARFSVDGVVLGDERTWDEVRFDLVDEGAMTTLAEIDGIDEQVIVVVDRGIDALVASVTTAVD